MATRSRVTLLLLMPILFRLKRDKNPVRISGELLRMQLKRLGCFLPLKPRAGFTQSFLLQTSGRGGESFSPETLQILSRPPSLSTAFAVALVLVSQKKSKWEDSHKQKLEGEQSNWKKGSSCLPLFLPQVSELCAVTVLMCGHCTRWVTLW